MAASSNDSFGLKIATALSIALTVVLLVAVYFLNSNYNEVYAKNAATEKKNGDLNNTIREFTNQANEWRRLAGYETIEDFETAKAAMKKDQEQLKSEVEAINTEIATTVDDFKKKIEAKGTDASQFETLKQRAREVVDGFRNNPDQSYKASLSRLKDLTANQAKLTTTLALNYLELRRDLELANQINSTQKKVVEDALATAKAELDATIKKDEEARSTLVETTRTQADAIAAAETKNQNLTNEMNTKMEAATKAQANLASVNKDLKDFAARKEEVMIKPGGRVTFVDLATNTIRVNVNKTQGVKPLMRFTIFDKNATGLLSDRPKAAVELIQVGDPRMGQNDSLARIVKVENPSDPIRYNDYIFSIGWSYDHPQRFALVGKLDVNRDGRDDRAQVIRMIEAAGGVIEFDLPPPNVDRSVGQAAVTRAYQRFGEPVPPSVGRAFGKITGFAFAYVIDNRPPLVLFAKKTPDATKDDTAFEQDKSTATREARDSNVRPLELEKLLNMLGYDYSAPIEGRRDGIDKPGIKELLKPKAGIKPPDAATVSPDAAKEEPAMPDTPK